MFNLSNINIISKEELNKYISDEEIFTFYFKEFDLNTLYLSPFRKENNPSFIISYYNDKLVYRDFGISNRPSGSIDFVCNLFNITYYEALNKIYKEVLNNKPYVKTYDRKTISHYHLKYNELHSWQLNYWKKGNISKNTLDLFQVKWCNELWFEQRLWSKGSKSNLMYYYNHNTVPYEDSWTVYRPLAESSKKFRKHNIDGKIMGLEYLPENGDILVITKSYKDIMCLYEIGISAIAPHNENIPIPKEIIDNLKTRFKKIYVNYDNDTTGVNSSIKFTTEYKLNYWNIPKTMGCKDPFECSCIHGLQVVKNLFNEKILRDG